MGDGLFLAVLNSLVVDLMNAASYDGELAYESVP